MKTYTSVEYKANTKQYNIEVEFYCQSGFGKVSFTINEEALSKIHNIQYSNVEILNYPGKYVSPLFFLLCKTLWGTNIDSGTQVWK